jgi:hypothetical protein
VVPCRCPFAFRMENRVDGACFATGWRAVIEHLHRGIELRSGMTR